MSSADGSGFQETIAAFEELFAHPNARPLDAPWIERYRQRRTIQRPIVEAADVEWEAPQAPVEPNEVQQAALRALEDTRAAGNQAGLVVLATGLGKTWLSAFDTSRPEFRRAQIDETMTRARQQLLEHFDEEVHEKLKINLRNSQACLNRYERLLMDLTRHELGSAADFIEGRSAFRLSNHIFCSATVSAAPAWMTFFHTSHCSTVPTSRTSHSRRALSPRSTLPISKS